MAAIRVLVIGLRSFGDFATWWNAPRYRLSLDDDTLALTQPRETTTVLRTNVMDVVDPGALVPHRAADGFIHILTRAHTLTIPPLFGPSGQLAEHLMRWQGAAAPIPPSQAPTDPGVKELPSRVYNQAVESARSGRPSPSTSRSIPGSHRWLLRGPHAGLVFASVFIEGLLRSPQVSSMWWMAAVVIVVSAGTPLVWAVSTHRRLRHRKGLAMVLFGDDILVRTQSGVHSYSAAATTIELRPQRAWSVFEGTYTKTRLILSEPGKLPMTFEDGELGLPPHVVQALIRCSKLRRV